MALIDTINYGLEKLAAKKQPETTKDDTVFFRGQSTDNDLVPSLWRECNRNNIPIFENKLYCDTFVAYPDYINTQSSWEFLALMQHFGVPTRLLDWTASLGNALFFAVEQCLYCNNECSNCQYRPTIWLLSPHKMHQAFYPDDDHINTRVSVTIGVDALKEYKECFLDIKLVGKRKMSWPWKKPIFLEVPWRNSRIKSQKGSFTFHYSKKPLNKYKQHVGFLEKISLTPDDIKTAKMLIKMLDLSTSDMYVDLSSFAQHLKRLYFTR